MPTRRAVLAGLGAAASTTAIAGCTNPLGGDGSGTSEYTDWMPADDQGTVAFSAISAADLAASDALPEGVLPEQQYGVDVEDIDLNVRYRQADIFLGSFDPATIRDGLESDFGVTLQEDGEYADYQLYGVESGDLTVGLKQDVAVLAQSDQFEPIADAEAGDEERLVDANDDFELLTSELGTADIINGGLRFDTDTDSQFFGENELASGQRVTVGSGDAELTHVFVFATEDDVDESGVRQRYEDQSNVSDVSSAVDGRVVTVSYTTPTDEFF